MLRIKLYARIRNQLIIELDNLIIVKIEKIPRTKKIFSEQKDSMLIELIYQIIEILLYATKSWMDLA